MRADGNCRACMVEIKGERVLAPSCCRAADGGHGSDERQRRARVHAQKMIVELLAADVPERVYKPDSELDALEALARHRHAALRARARSPRPTCRIRRWRSISTPASSARAACAPAARSRSTTSSATRFAARIRRSCSTSTTRWATRPASRAANACRRARPARSRRRTTRTSSPLDKKVVHRCARIAASAASSPITSTTTRSSASKAATAPPTTSACASRAASASTTCTHPQRLTKPLIRKPGRAEVRRLRHGSGRSARGVPRGELGRGAGARRRHARARSATTHGGSALAGFGSAKGSNEEAYLFQKLVRTGFGTNNVDHCTRLCHASSVAALLEGIGSGAVSNPVMDVMKADVVLLIGANPVVNHPVAATWIKNAVKNGTQADPRRPAALGARAPRDALPAVQAGHRRRAAERDDAHDHRGRPGRRRRSSPTAPAATRSCKRNVAGYSPEAMAPICGIPAATIREVARHVRDVARLDDPLGHGHLAARARHRQRALPDRAVDDDRAGRPARHRAASAARPEQRAGRERRRADPDDVSRTTSASTTPDAQQSSRRCGARRSIRSPASPSSRSWTPCTPGEIRGMYIMGENPAMSDPDVAPRAAGAGRARDAGRAGHLPHRDRRISPT